MLPFHALERGFASRRPSFRTTQVRPALAAVRHRAGDLGLALPETSLGALAPD